MDVYQLRLQLLLGRRPEGSDSDLEHSAGIPAESSIGIGCGHRLSRLAHPTWVALPVAEAVVRDPALRRGRIAAPHSPARATRAAVRGVGAERRSVRVGCADTPESRLLSAQKRRWCESDDTRSLKPQRRPVSNAYEAEREINLAA